MNELTNLKSQLTDDKRLHESAQQQPTDELLEIGIARLEEVAGGGVGPHDPYSAYRGPSWVQETF
jgi:hypothetical protein